MPLEKLNLPDFLTELRHVLRGLRGDPVFAVTALVILALGCGAFTAMLTAVRGLLLEPLPYPEPDRLLSVYELRPGHGDTDAARAGVALDTLEDWRQVEAFESLAGYRLRSFGLQTALGDDASGSDVPLSEIEVVQVGMATSGLFATFGIEPQVGRDFTTAEEKEGAAVIVIGHELRQRAFGRDQDVLGRLVWLNGQARTVVGVLPADFRMVIRGRVPDAYIPISHADYGDGRDKRALEVIARLRDGVDPAAAQTELTALGDRLAAGWPKTHAGMSIGAESLDASWRGANRRPLGMLLAGAGLLLLIAYANVAGLMLARSLRLRRRRAIRAALGAGRWNLALPSLLEGALLGLGGGLAGLWIAKLGLDGLPLALPALGGAAPVAGFDLASLRLDPGSAAIACGLALACGLFFGAWPAWRMRRRRPVQDLGATAGPTRELARSGSLVVVAQVALGTLLLLAAGLLGRSFLTLLNTDPGFDSAAVTSFGLGLPEARYDTEPKIIEFHRRLHEELATLPGVEHVGAAARRPLVRGFRTVFEREDQPSAKNERLRSAINVVSDGYFEALRIPLRAGRLPSWNDDTDLPRVLVINEAFQRAYFPELSVPELAGDVLGKRLRLTWWSELTPRGTPWEIVGVVGDVRQQGLDQAATPEIYLPFSQYPSEGASYVLRTESGEIVSGDALAAAVAGLDPELQRITAKSARQWTFTSLADRRLALWVVAVLGLAALLTTAIGVYALVATDVAGRRREMAVRQALGARNRDLSRLVIGRSLKLVSLGFAVGATGFVALAPGLQRMLYGVGTSDPVTFLAIWALLLVMAFTAAVGPASRAADTESLSRQA